MKSPMLPLSPLDPLQRYTIDEALNYLRTSRATFYEKVNAGVIRLLKDGRRSYVPGTAIIEQSRAA